MFFVGYENSQCLKKAEEISQKYNFVLDNDALPRLQVTENGLLLLAKGFSPLKADFASKDLLRRYKAGKDQGIIRACKPRLGLKILDATSGWGRDAALLASFGAEVLMLERQPIMALLLEDALIRMKSTNQNLALSLVAEDALIYLNQISTTDAPDLIYIDPMHPVRQKSALVKKDMQVLQKLFGQDQNVLELIQLAREKALQRVVVKWPQRLEPVMPANQTIDGKTVRFDIYVC